MAIMTADGYSQVGVCMIVQEKSHSWIIESTQFRRPDVVSCKVVTGKWTPLIRDYLPPSTLEHLVTAGGSGIFCRH